MFIREKSSSPGLIFNWSISMIPQNNVLFEARNISKYFGGVTALSDGNLKIYSGRICGLLGANGSGKSTISKIINGIYQPSGGELLYRGEHVEINSPAAAAAMNIAMIHQHLSLVPELTVWQNICLGIEKRGRAGFMDDPESKKAAEAVLREFSEEIDLEAQVKNLSPAEKQLVEIAKAFIKEPEILILDEPTAALEQEEVKKLFAVLSRFKDRMAMIFISHRMWEVFQICDYITVFKDGKSVGDIDFAVETKDEKRIVSMITGDDEGCEEREILPACERVKDTQFEVKGLELKGMLHDINLSIKEGEILGISGLQGQGQEELLLALAGYLQCSGGSFHFKGNEIKIRHPKNAISSGIVLVPGDRNEEGLFTQHDINTNLVFPQFSGRSHRGLLDSASIRQESIAVMKKLSVAAHNENQKVSELSGGNQQKVVVGKWLALKPRVLLLSDPAKGVDVHAKEELYNVVRELAETGTSVILFASDNTELISICDRICVMFEGRIVQDLENDCLTDQVLVTHALQVGCGEEKSDE